MGLTITLTDEEVSRLRESASACGLPLDEYARRLLTGQSPQEPPNGASKAGLSVADGKLIDGGLMLQAPTGSDPEAYRRYRPVQIAGKPLSESIVEERR